jgi:hypothetical protein
VSSNRFEKVYEFYGFDSEGELKHAPFLFENEGHKWIADHELEFFDIKIKYIDFEREGAYEFCH